MKIESTAAGRVTPSMSNPSRRRVLGGLAAGLAPLILPARMFGAGAPSNRVNVAMIGTGRQTYFTNLPSLLGLPEVRVVSVCDVDRKRAEETKKKVDAHYGDTSCKLFTDWREALEMPGVDAIMNSTPDHWHVIISLAAIAKGIHVSCEKPLTRYLAEGRVLADAAARKGIVFRTDTECRSHSFMRRTADLAINGYLGNIRRIEVGVPKEGGKTFGDASEAPVPPHLDYEMWLGPAAHKPYAVDRVHPETLNGRPGWMRITDYGEGIVTNWGTHLLDVAQLLLGTERSGPVAVEGQGIFPPEGSLWDVMIGFDLHYRYANGVKLEYKMAVPYIRVEGDEGWVQAHWNSEGGITASDPKILRTKFKDSDIRQPAREDKEDFIQAILGRAKVMIDAEIGHRTCSMGQIGHIALRLGRPLEWDPAVEKFKNAPEADAMLQGTYRGPWKL